MNVLLNKQRLAIMIVCLSAWVSGLSSDKSAAESIDKTNLYLELEGVVRKAMTLAETNTSNKTRMEKTVRVVTDTAVKQFSDKEVAKAWIHFLSAHSQLDHYGPRGNKKKGIGRLNDRHFSSLKKLCQRSERSKKSMRDLKVNTEVSACYFDKLYQATLNLSSTVAFYLEGGNAGSLLSGRISPPAHTITGEEVNIHFKLFPDDDAVMLRFATKSLDHEMLQLQLSTSKEPVERRMMNAWIERRVSSLLGLSDKERRALAALQAYFNRFQSYSSAHMIPRSIRKSVVGLGAVSKKLSRIETAGCKVEGLATTDTSDSFRSMFLSACVIKQASRYLDQVGSDSSTPAIFAYVTLFNRGIIAARDFTMPPISPEHVKLSPEENHLVEAVVGLINLTNLRYGKINPHVFSDKLLAAYASAHVANQVFINTQRGRDWLALIRIESNFDHEGKSSVGAMGLGQLLPQYASDFGKTCGASGFNKTDVKDLATNAFMSACYFSKLINEEDLISFALVGYNAGPHSKALERVKNLSGINHESANYVTRWNVVTELLNRHHPLMDRVNGGVSVSVASSDKDSVAGSLP